MAMPLLDSKRAKSPIFSASVTMPEGQDFFFQGQDFNLASIWGL